MSSLLMVSGVVQACVIMTYAWIVDHLVVLNPDLQEVYLTETNILTYQFPI